MPEDVQKVAQAIAALHSNQTLRSICQEQIVEALRAQSQQMFHFDAPQMCSVENAIVLAKDIDEAVEKLKADLHKRFNKRDAQRFLTACLKGLPEGTTDVIYLDQDYD